MKRPSKTVRSILTAGLLLWLGSSQALAADGSLGILRDGLLGAGVGALSAEASGGKAGKGALIGAGVNVLGNVLFGLLGGSSSSSPSVQPVTYAAAPRSYSVPAPVAYVQPEPVYVQPAPIYVSSAPVSQSDTNRQILKQGLLGAGVGAISAGSSGGKAGQGALIGAGTNVIGGALLDVLTSPAQASSAPVYAGGAYGAPTSWAGQASGSRKHVVRKYDADGRLVSEEEYWD